VVGLVGVPCGDFRQEERPVELREHEVLVRLAEDGNCVLQLVLGELRQRHEVLELVPSVALREKTENTLTSGQLCVHTSSLPFVVKERVGLTTSQVVRDFLHFSVEIDWIPTKLCVPFIPRCKRVIFLKES